MKVNKRLYHESKQTFISNVYIMKVNKWPFLKVNKRLYHESKQMAVSFKVNKRLYHESKQTAVFSK